MPIACTNTYLSTTTHTATLTINSTTEKVYYPTIYLQDLAGNTALISNNTAKTSEVQNILKTTNPNSPKGYIGQSIWSKPFGIVKTIDTAFLLANPSTGNNYTTSNTIILPPSPTADQTDILNGNTSRGVVAIPCGVRNNSNASNNSTTGLLYPYCTTPRTQSLDFSLLIDNQNTTKGNFDLAGWGDLIDGICSNTQTGQNTVESDRNLTDKRYFNSFDSATTNQNKPNCTTPLVNSNNLNNSYSPQYVIKGNQIEFYTVIEKSQRVVLGYSYKNSPTSFILSPTNTQTGTCSSNAGSDTRSSATDNNGVTIANGQRYTTKFKDTCKIKFTFTFPDDGKGVIDQNNTPANNYQFSFYSIDLAGNLSTFTAINQNSNNQIPLNQTINNTNTPNVGNTTISNNPNIISSLNDTVAINLTRSNTVTVYHDTLAPQNTGISNISSASYNPVVDFQNTNQNTNQNTSLNTAITKDTSLNSTHYGETYSDVEYQSYQAKNIITNPNTANSTTTNPNNNYQASYYSLNGADGQGTQSNITIGSTNRDDATPATCTTTSNTPIKNRRIGTCDDGLYTIKTRMTDTAGNVGDWVSKVVERDTVAPSAPSINLSKTPDANGAILGEYLNLNITAEAGSRAYVTVQDTYGNKMDRNFDIDQSGNYQNSNFLGKKLYCGGITYTVKVRLADRAGNVSEFSADHTVTTTACPSCTSSGNGELSIPVRKSEDPTADVSAEFATYEPGHKGPHAGIDIAAQLNTNIYAAKSGKVIAVNMGTNSTNSWGAGWGNYVIVEHYDSNNVAVMQTIYAHMMNLALVTVNQIVDTNTVIGKVGSSGNSTGAHLHFQIEVDGATLNPIFTGKYNRWPPVNPRTLLGDITGNLNQAQQAIFCNTTNSVGDTTNIDYPVVTEAEARDIIAGYIIFSLDDNTQIERNERNTQLYTTKGSLGNDNKNNINFLKPFITPGLICENVWYQNLGQIYQNGNNQSKSGYDGAIVINNYTKTAYLVKNAMFDKWINNNGCGIIGVPSAEEVNFDPPSASMTQDNQAWYQRFKLGNYTNNSIYAYYSADVDCRFLDPCTQHGNPFYTFWVTGDVANEYEANGGAAGKYLMPRGDTFSVVSNEKPCMQYFEGQNGVAVNYNGILKCEDSENLAYIAKILNDKGKVDTDMYKAILFITDNSDLFLSQYIIMNDSKYRNSAGQMVKFTLQDWVDLQKGTSPIDKNAEAQLTKDVNGQVKAVKGIAKVADLLSLINIALILYQDYQNYDQSMADGVFPYADTAAAVAGFYVGNIVTIYVSTACIGFFVITTAGAGAIGCSAVAFFSGVMVGKLVSNGITWLFKEVLTRDNINNIRTTLTNIYFNWKKVHLNRNPGENDLQYILRIRCELGFFSC